MSFKRFLLEVYKKHFKFDSPARTAYFTYYLLISFFPFTIFITAVLSSTPLINELQLNFDKLIPHPMNDFFSNVLGEIENKRNVVLISTSIIGTVWAASRSIRALIKSVNYAYEIKETRNPILVNIQAIIIIITFAVLFITIVTLVVYGDMVFKHISYSLGLKNMYYMVKYIFNLVIPALVIFILSLFIYKVTPSKNMRLKGFLPGAGFSSIGIIIVSKLFSIYVNNFSNYTKLYGSLAWIIIFLIWLNFISTIFLVGVEINAVLYLKRVRGGIFDNKHKV